MKEGVQTAKNKADKKELTENLKSVYMGFEKNMNNSKLTLNKL